MKITHASRLGNAELTAELIRLARGEREATAALIVHLAEFDARRLFEGAGFSSLFRYCRKVLHLSEDAVYNRIKAARAARRYPVIVDRLESGALSLTTVRLLAPRLTPENHQELLTAASGKGKQAVEELLAHRFPQPDVPARVRKVPSRPVTPEVEGVGGRCVHAGYLSSCRGAARRSRPRLVRDAAPSTRAGGATGRPPARTRAVRDPLHGQHRDAREAARRPGTARARHSQR